MVAIVSGIRNGLNLTSAEVLGFKDVIGGNLQGRNGQGVNVNVALGQVVLQGQDDLLVGRGDDARLVRTYDARGNLRDIADGRAHIVMEYDQVGNRARVATYVDYQGVAGEAASSTDRYFQYDAMNRQTVVDAVDAAGNLGSQGHQIAYDRSGNRTRDVSWGTRVATSGGEQVITGYDEDWNAIYASSPVAYAASPGYSTEEYRYDALNRLASVVRDGVQIDVRHYDGADRVIQSGPGGNLPLQYAEIINQGVAPGEMNGKEARVSRYDANGRLMHQTVLKSDNTTKLNISWDVNETASDLGITFRPDGYDAAGNVLGYTVTNHEAGVINKYTTSLARFDGYQASTTHGQSTKQLPGDSTQQYDVNGYLVGVVDSTQPANNRTFVNDATGKALYVNQAGNVQRQLIVNGEVLGLYGAGVDPNRPASGYNNNPNFANIVDFDFGYARVSANYPSASPGAYTIRTGDTLQSISQSAYGDSALWYRIAEANGLASNSDLKVGQTLNVPNRVSTISNNSTTFKPYDPSQIEGDKTPSLATPQPKKKKGGLFGKLLMIIVAIVVTIFTAGAMAVAMSAVTAGTSTFAAGMAALAGGTLGTTALTTGVMGSIAGTAMVSSAVGAAVGSIVSQGVGIATGVQDEFSWRSVGLSALSAGATAGLGGTGLLAGSDTASLAVRAAVANAATQGIAVATGLQQKFDWRGVAASAVGAGVGHAVAPGMGGIFGADSFGQRLASGLVAGAAAAVARGGRVAVQQVAVDAFGNALGQSIVQNSNSAPAIQGAGPWSDRDRVNGADLQSDEAYEARRAQEWIGQIDTIQSGRVYELTASNAHDNFRATEKAYRQELETVTQISGLDLPSDYSFPQQDVPRDTDLVRSQRQMLSGQARAGTVSAPRTRDAGADRGFTNPAAAVLRTPSDTSTQAAQSSFAPTAQVPADSDRASMVNYWTAIEEAGLDGRSFGKYIFGKTMRAFGNFAYDAGDALVGGVERPSDIRDGTYKAAANFGPDSFNGAANLLKGSLNGWTLLAEKLGLPEGQFAGFRSSNPFNIDPLFSYDNKTQAGAGLMTGLVLGAATANFGGYGMVFEDIGAAGPMAGQMGAVRISLVTPNASAGRLLAVNREGVLYPEIPDLRTGRPIQFPEGEIARVDKAARAAWDSSADRYTFIKEWSDRGYATPPGGWKQYDIHHVRPLEFGGTNTFWNLAPVQRQTHVQMFNKFWRGY